MANSETLFAEWFVAEHERQPDPTNHADQLMWQIWIAGYNAALKQKCWKAEKLLGLCQS